jgi:hypothetical protein
MEMGLQDAIQGFQPTGRGRGPGWPNWGRKKRIGLREREGRFERGGQLEGSAQLRESQAAFHTRPAPVLASA